MDWTQVYAIIGANLALIMVSIGTTTSLFLWARSEARHDQAQLRDIMAQDRRDMLQIIREIQEEMKDFHARLCVIEQQKKECKK